MAGCAAPTPRMEDLHLIVGLGNPGGEYAKTRHNAGFLLTDLLAERWRVAWSAAKKFQSRVAKAEVVAQASSLRTVAQASGLQTGGTPAPLRVVLCEPQTFMNASGEAVGAVVKFYQLPLKNLVVAMDDADLPLGEIRLRPGGSSGGHHGLESIERHLGTREFARLRLGIGRQSGAREITGHVLGRLNAGELTVMGKILGRAADQLECWLAHGLQKAMSQFNGVVNDAINESKAQ